MNTSAKSQLQDLVLNLRGPSDPLYKELLTVAQNYFPPDEWQKINSVDPEDKDFPPTQQALLIPAKIVASILSQITPSQTSSLKEIIEKYKRHKHQTHVSPPHPSSPISKASSSLTLGLKSASRLSSLTTLKTPYSKYMPKIILTPKV